MSVAFRRDSDEEHLEPRFEIPIPSGPNLVTTRGLKLILAYKAGLEAQIERTDDDAVLASLRRDLRYWNTRQVTAVIAPVPVGTKVEIGTQVTISLNGKTRTLNIVGHDEAEPAAGLISYDAPLSRAVLGAEVGDVLPFADSPDAIEILEIEVSAQDS